MMVKVLLFAVVFGAAVQSGIAQAESSTEVGHILSFETGWSADSISVALDVPFVNPAHCTKTSSYAVSPDDPGARVHEAAIMGAFFGGKNVQLRIDGCAYDKPKIIGVVVRN
ncbi:MAG: hypothetical protein IPN42_08950 [Methylococcaceae bacterium]|nr:hypothetical protein [Methylococcaceae bacterium]